jgi:nucleoside-diphosphate-sugar epimerase
MPDKIRVLVTGSSGLIGGVAIRALQERYDFYGLDRVRLRGGPDIPISIADIYEYDQMKAAFNGMEAVVHLAADASNFATWESVLHNNLVPVYNVFEAAREAGVRRVVFASSNHAVGMWELESAAGQIRTGDYEGLDPRRVPQIDDTVRIRPDGFYGVGKAFGEAMGAYYADEFGIEVACLRIGTVSREDDPTANIRMRATWLSHRDIAHLIDRCLAVEKLHFEIFYGVSRNKWRFWDISLAVKFLDYDPQDDAEDHY